MNWSDVIPMISNLIGALAGAGPWGILAMVLGGGALAGVAYWAISKWNAKVDKGDMERAGADAGRTAADLRRQAEGGRKMIDEMGKDFKP